MGTEATVAMIAPDGTSADVPVSQQQKTLAAGAKPAYSMLAPDGSHAYVPPELVSVALKAGAKLANFSQNPKLEGTYPMWDTNGQRIGVPYSLVNPAHGAGYQFDTNADSSGLTPAQRFSADYAADPARKNDTGDQVSAPRTWAQQLGDMVTHPLNSLESAAQPTSRPANASIGEMAATDLSNVASGASQVIRHPVDTAEGMLSQGLGVRPIVENAVNDLSQQLGGKKLYQPAPIVPQNPEQAAYALGQTAATAGLAKSVPVLADVASAANDVAGNATQAARRAIAGDVNAPIAGTTPPLTPAARYESMKAMGVQPNAAEATNSTPLNMAEKVNQNSLTAQPTYNAARATNLAALKRFTDRTLDLMSPVGPEEGGAAVQQGLRDAQTGLQNDAAQGFSELDRAVGNRKLAGQTIQETAKNIYDANADYFEKHPSLIPGNAWKIVKDLAGADNDFQSRPMSFSEVHQLRTDLLEMVRTNPDIVKNQAGGWLQQLAQAADQTMTQGATGLSAAGVKVFRDANDAWANMKGTYDNPSHPFYQAVRSPSPSTLVNGISKTPEMAKTLQEALGPEGIGPIQRGVAENLLKTTKEGGYNFKTFQGQWNKLPEAYRNALFTPEQQQALADIGNAGTVLHEDLNPSGTAKLGQGLAEGGTLAGSVVHPPALAANVVYHAGQYMLGKLMNAPTFVDWLMRDQGTAAAVSDPHIGPAGQPNFYPDEYLRSKAAFDAARNAAQ